MHPRRSQASTSAPFALQHEGPPDSHREHFRRRPLSLRTLHRSSRSSRCASAAAAPRGSGQARAVAITWGEHLQEEQFGGAAWGDWSYEEQQQQQGDVSERGAAQTVRRGRPLKINRDLLLHRAKVERQLALRAGNVADKLQHQRAAEAALRRCLAMDATDGRTYVALGKLLTQQRRSEEARAVYEEGCTATAGANAYIWQAWATLEARSGNTSKARKLFDAAIVADRGHAASWHGWGLLEKRAGNLNKAKDLWMKGIAATRGRPNPHLYQSIAVLAGEMGFVDEARQWFREGTRALAGRASHALWHGWALLEAAKGEASAVRYLFRKGLEANMRSRYIHLSWGLWEKAQGQPDNARRLFKRGHELNPQDAPLLQAWALLEEEAGKVEEARQLFEAGSRADPHHLFIWQAWGVLEHRAGNLDRARELFQQGVWAQPRGRDVATVWQAWGVLETRAGNISLARQLFKCAVRADPASEKSWLSWAELEEAEGALARAQELRSYRLQEWNQVVLPASFGAMFDAAVLPGSASSSEQPFRAVFDTIRDWFSKVDNARAIAKRPPPSYMRLGDSGDDSATGPPVEDVPSLDEMQRYNSSELRLPEVPKQDAEVAATPPHAYNWAELQGRGMRRKL